MYKHTVVARDKSGKILGQKDVVLGETVSECITLKHATSEEDLVDDFNRHLVVEIQNELRTNARGKTSGEIKRGLAASKQNKITKAA